VTTARLLAAITLAVAVLVRPAVAADAGSDALQLEIAGIEFTPFSFNYSSPDRGSRPSAFQPGLGLALRLVKLRWSSVYWTVVQGGFFSTGGSDPEAMFFHADTEVGVTLHTEAHVFELGLGAGAGILGIRHQASCNETCRVGGGAVFMSPVARYRFRDAAPSVALVARAEVLAVNTGTTCWGNPCTGRATLFLLGFDVGFGRVPAPRPPPAPAP
jgi:hypothetical protein